MTGYFLAGSKSAGFNMRQYSVVVSSAAFIVPVSTRGITSPAKGSDAVSRRAVSRPLAVDAKAIFLGTSGVE